jgi:dihydrolipoamide dehydrogenase
MSTHFDLIVIGGGPGGYVAAIRAAQLGLRTVLVEKQHLGGICLNWGCIPTKALLHGAEMAHRLSQMEHLGFTAQGLDFDIRRLVKRSREVSAQLTDGIEYLLKKNNVEVILGKGSMVGKGRVRVDSAHDSRELRADHVILATGARPRALPGISGSDSRIWSYFEALVPETLPESLLVIGSGAIGSEFASLYSDLGTRVTLVEMAEQILPSEDADVSTLVAAQFEKRGITVHRQASVSSLQALSHGLECTLKFKDGREQTVAVERVLVAAGIQANSENLGLEALGVDIERGFIKTDQWSRTNVAGLYAVGDVAGAPCLAHKASNEAIICVERLAGVEHVKPLDRSKIPACTFARPQVASVGMTEAQAHAAGRDIKVGSFPFKANGKALILGESEGFVKVIFDRHSDELLGAHLVGPEVTELIQGFTIASSLEATAQDLIASVFAHPSLSEAMHEAVLAAHGHALHY